MPPLAWAFAILYISGALGYLIVRWTHGNPAVPDGRPRCPTCGLLFTPSGATRWSAATECLDGVNYCTDCKWRGVCGCG